MAKRLKQRIYINGQTKWVTGYSHQEVLESALKLLNALAEANATPQKDYLFAPYAQNWKALYKENSLKHTTLREYTTLLNKHILPVFGEQDIRAITTDDIQRFMNSKADMSKKSIHEMVMVLGMVLESAVEDGIITRNPARSKRLKNPSKKKAVRNALDREQIVDIIANLHRLNDERDVLLLALLIYTGMRRDEVLGLKWENIDFKNNLIYVVRGVTFKCNLPHIDTPKTDAAIRSIPMPAALRQYLHPLENHLFVIGGGEQPITEQTMKRMWERIKKTINVYGATPHVFRHTFMTFADREAVPLKTLQAIGGYADIYTLKNRYTHTQQEDIESARQRIDNMFSPVLCDIAVTAPKAANP